MLVSRLSPPPSHRPGDPPARTDERSQVRPRGDGFGYASVEADPIGQRRERAEELLRRANGVLAKLAASDPRAALLGLAVQRRDVVLIEAVLSELRER